MNASDMLAIHMRASVSDFEHNEEPARLSLREAHLVDVLRRIASGALKGRAAQAESAEALEGWRAADECAGCPRCLRHAEKEIEQLKAENAELRAQLAPDPEVAKKLRAYMREQLVEKLDWSVRAHSVITRKLAVDATIADAVAIPPAEWLKVPRCTMLVIREMDKLFKSLGVEWPGEWPRR